jgi:hypothetical protein
MRATPPPRRSVIAGWGPMGAALRASRKIRIALDAGLQSVLESQDILRSSGLRQWKPAVGFEFGSCFRLPVLTEQLVATESGIGVPHGNTPDRDHTNTRP